MSNQTLRASLAKMATLGDPMTCENFSVEFLDLEGYPGSEELTMSVQSGSWDVGVEDIRISFFVFQNSGLLPLAQRLIAERKTLRLVLSLMDQTGKEIFSNTRTCRLSEARVELHYAPPGLTEMRRKPTPDWKNDTFNKCEVEQKALLTDLAEIKDLIVTASNLHQASASSVLVANLIFKHCEPET